MRETGDSSRPSTRTVTARLPFGLMIAVLAFIPLRRKNIAIEIGRHLIQDGDSSFIIISCIETKTGTPTEFAVPELLGPYLATYLDVARPRLLRRPCNALWISQKGGALSYSAIWDHYSAHGPTAWSLMPVGDRMVGLCRLTQVAHRRVTETNPTPVILACPTRRY